MRASKIAVAAAVGLALITGLAWGSLLVSTGSPNGANGTGGSSFFFSSNGNLGAELATIRAALDDERRAHRDLEEEVAWLREELEIIAPYENADSYEPADAPDVSAAPSKPASPPRTRVFDEEALIASGVSEAEIERLRERFDEAEMGELYIRDRATREGWLNRPRFRKSLDKHRSTVREEFSDDDFDLMLYASHRRNRVAAQHVLRGSPGAQAGLLRGDIILSYNDERVFSPRDLQHATTTVPVGSPVSMRVQRGGQELTLYIPGGPIGTKLTRKSVQPEIP